MARPEELAEHRPAPGGHTGVMLAAEATTPLSHMLAAVALAGVLSIAGALVGDWFGKRQERGNQHQAWLKDRRLAAYTELAAAVGQVVDEDLKERRRGAATEPGAPSAWTKVLNAQETAKLVGPEQLNAKVRQVGAAATDYATLARDATLKEREAKAAEVGDLLRDFIQSAAEQIQGD